MRNELLERVSSLLGLAAVELMIISSIWIENNFTAKFFSTGILILFYMLLVLRKKKKTAQELIDEVKE